MQVGKLNRVQSSNNNNNNNEDPAASIIVQVLVDPHLPRYRCIRKGSRPITLPIPTLVGLLVNQAIGMNSISIIKLHCHVLIAAKGNLINTNTELPYRPCITLTTQRGKSNNLPNNTSNNSLPPPELTATSKLAHPPAKWVCQLQDFLADSQWVPPNDLISDLKQLILLDADKKETTDNYLDR